MTAIEVLDKRIATATRRYAAALDEVLLQINHEKERIDSGYLEKYFEVSTLTGAHNLMKLNSELGALLALKDHIENQAREAIAQ